MIAQTFYVTDPTYDTPGIFVTFIQLFFGKLPVDNNVGITLAIHEVENGIPTQNIVPFAKCRYLTSTLRTIVPGYDTQAKLNSSIDGVGFLFGVPPFLKTQTEYAMVISADGDNPDFELWTSELSKTDRGGKGTISTNPSTGVLMTSSNGRTWTAYQNEDLKFRIVRAKFPTLEGNLTFTNANTEFLQREVLTNSKPFLRGEKVFVSNGVIGSSNVLTSKTSTTITITPANSAYLNATNKLIYLASNGQSQTDIRQILGVVNGAANTILTINASPTFNDNNATIGFLYSNGALYGEETYINGTRDLILKRSTANSTMNFRELYVSKNTNPLLIGEISGTAANLYSLGVYVYDEIVPQFARAEPPKTDLTISFKGASLTSNTLDTSFINIDFDKNQKLVDKSRVVRSRSDELYFNSGTKSLQIKADFTSNTDYLTPTLNDIKRSALLIHNKVSRANSQLIINEASPSGGKMGNKYISKSVLLTQEAEDLVVYLTAYRPANTEIYVFCKLLNREDSESLDNKYWSLMEEVTPKPYSSKVDLSDNKELQYIISSGTGATLTPTAFLNSNNSSIVRYYNEGGSYFDGYNTFALKIILTSDQSYIVPRVGDMRAIAVQI